MATSPSPPPPVDAGRSGWRQRVLLLVAVLTVCGALLVRFLLPMDARGQSVQLLRELGAEVNLGALTATELDLPLEGAPDGPDKGQSHRLREAMTTGDVVVLHFWAGWCPPCLEELPDLVAFAGAVRDLKVTVLAVGYDDAWADADAALQKAAKHRRPPAITWWRDPQGQDGDQKKMLRIQFGTEQLPETYVLHGGQIVARFIAGQPWTSAKMLRVFQLLAAPRGAGT